jgi:hypothetical protein
MLTNNLKHYIERLWEIISKFQLQAHVQQKLCMILLSQIIYSVY